MSYVQARERARALIFGSEGFVTHMYLDSVSVVTIGYGTALQSVAEAEPLALSVIATGQPATSAQKAAEWERVQAISPRGTARNFSARSYAAAATLSISLAEAVRHFNTRLDNFATRLGLHYPLFSQFPEDAQVALLDMVYNLGPNFPPGWPRFTNAINRAESDGGPDWRTAAEQSNRPQLSVERNQEVRNLFNSAADQAEAARRSRGPR